MTGPPYFKAPPKPKRKGRRQIPDRVKREVRDRSGGRCEVHLENGDRCEFTAQQMHHRKRRSQGGQDTAENLLHVCNEHHDLIHAQIPWAVSKGYLIHRGTGPEPESSAVVRVEKIER